MQIEPSEKCVYFHDIYSICLFSISYFVLAYSILYKQLTECNARTIDRSAVASD